MTGIRFRLELLTFQRGTRLITGAPGSRAHEAIRPQPPGRAPLDGDSVR